jgi:predicted enzyme related to lactoylglutathione lyase
MLNYRVDDLDGMLGELRDAGVEVDDVKGTEEYGFGRFAWITDPDGRVELWEPAAGW